MEVAWADFDRHRIEIVLWPGCPPTWAIASLVHELAHFVCDNNRHDESFRTSMIELVRDGYGARVAWTRSRELRALDHAIEDALMPWFRERYGEELLLQQLSSWLASESRRR